jgi:hypothetical protein
VIEIRVKNLISEAYVLSQNHARFPHEKLAEQSIYAAEIINLNHPGLSEEEVKIAVEVLKSEESHRNSMFSVIGTGNFLLVFAAIFIWLFISPTVEKWYSMLFLIIILFTTLKFDSERFRRQKAILILNVLINIRNYSLKQMEVPK